jgi:hypothetical protein
MRRSGSLIRPVIGELHVDAEVAAQGRDDLLQRIAVLADTRTRSPWMEA